MNVCIVTLYNSENCGSFLQAYVLGKVVSDLGHNVTYFERKMSGTYFSTNVFIKNIVKKIIYSSLQEAKFLVVKRNTFAKANKIFNITKDNKKALEKIDCFILGSDTIWYIEKEYFKDTINVFWGNKFNFSKVISYAPSIDNTSDKTLENTPCVKEALENMQQISVRDRRSHDAICKITCKPVSVVCDPTMLWSSEEYSLIMSKCPHNGFILLYLFYDSVDLITAKRIIEFAHSLNKIVISLGRYYDWCDYSIPYNPYDFLSYYANADYVITNTFHGTIFSIIFNKKFVCSPDNKSKIIELLTQMELMERKMSIKDDFIEILISDIDYNAVNRRVELIRKQSIKFLMNSLECE
jgi:hypothetical protein